MEGSKVILNRMLNEGKNIEVSELFEEDVDDRKEYINDLN